MKQFMTAFSILFLCAATVFSKAYIRYNYIGYNPSREKRIVVMAEEGIDGTQWTLRDNETGEEVLSGNIGASVYERGDHLPFDYNYVFDITELREVGEYTLSLAGDIAEPANIVIHQDPYGDLISKPLRWLREARCGSDAVEDREICHLGDKKAEVFRRADPHDNGSWGPLDEPKYFDGHGGWHDAGDYLKFSLTCAYTTYYILRAYDINPSIFDTLYNNDDGQNELNDLLDEAQWGLDFLMRTMPDTNEFMIMIGHNEDHHVGYRLPQDDHLDGERPFLSALSIPQMGYTAAALALGATIFEELGREEQAQEYFEKAQLIYRRALSDDAEATAWLDDDANPFYRDDTNFDNLQLAAGELYRFSGDPSYLEDAQEFADLARGAGWKAWTAVNMTAHMNIMDDYPVAQNYLYLDLDQFLDNSRAAGNIWGIPMRYVWAGLYSYIGVGATAAEYELLTGNTGYHSLARNMTDYLLGYNNWGICFIAIEDMENTITEPNSQIYMLQADKFPEGAIAEGPGDRESWEYYSTYFGFDMHAEWTHKFNTEAGVFYDNRKDFMCMETTVVGMSDGIYLLAVASKLFNN
ncbi:glycoside hydrolase family 9 protein [Chitinivibrio alkaliphilus]|uniref:Glycoside hydrolase, GH9 family n=1 Tax=Chitinivibrio alkaliphilus ACht1 TaxID=1313304 RepID=U7D529_9BACT|nr:glycoside hydrolase family 9 protein [Chitinivibrio alkaliphilus]ERP31048.1 glycoside hydrolase, GH9 family [Chitinivibrio alkaliphilus ACht1]